MTPQTTDIPDAQLEALAEGDLPEEGRRTLLLRLDQKPDGWRRLALAFLEAQALREALGAPASVRTSAPRATPTIVPLTPTKTQRRVDQRVAWLAAAAVVAAFLLGWGVAPRPQPQTTGPALQPVAVAPKPSLAEQL